jgi:hypothetical protein
VSARARIMKNVKFSYLIYLRRGDGGTKESGETFAAFLRVSPAKVEMAERSNVIFQ